MNKIRIGVLCPSEIAFRRFMPALLKQEGFTYEGIAYATPENWSSDSKPSPELYEAERAKAVKFQESYGGKIFKGYHEILNKDAVDAIYIPLPPALHFQWAEKALKAGLHVLLEKPFTTSLSDTRKLLDIADSSELAVHENYMFVYHSQLEWIQNKLAENAVGDIRLIRIDFGFPFRGNNDFRYDKSLGGGALLDCGGYTLKLAGMLLGDTAEITACQLNNKPGFGVDIYGSATLTNSDGLTAQVSFGMDNDYRCSLDVWGSEGRLFTNRILTAPDGYQPTVAISRGNETQTFTLEADDTFAKSIRHFEDCIRDKNIRSAHYGDIFRQSKLVEQIKGKEA